MNPDMQIPPATDKGTLPNLRFSFSDAHTRMEDGGWAREVTQRELPVATTLAGVNMRLNPGGVRELHWHKQAEWAYMLTGSARVTAVDPDGRNFIDDVTVGQGWNFPAGIPHSIQGLEQGCEFLLAFDDGKFSENDTFLVSDWLAHVPREVIEANFGVSANELAQLPSEELYIFQAPVPPPLKAQAVRSPQGKVPLNFTHHLLDQKPERSSGGSVRIIDSTTFPAASTITAALVVVEPGGMRELHWHPSTDEWRYSWRARRA
jgi:oxalate decarboxylase